MDIGLIFGIVIVVAGLVAYRIVSVNGDEEDYPNL